MSERGVFAVDRGIWDHPVLASNEPFSRTEAWIWLISEAAWKPHRHRVGGTLVNVDRGQICHSLRYLAARWRWSVKRIRVFLQHLETDTMITTQTDTGVTLITICNYDEYQKVSLPKGTENGTEEDTPGAHEGHKVENIKNKESKKDISTKSTSDWPKDAFEQFWKAYPRKVGKKAALRRFELVAKAREITFPALLAAIGRIEASDPKFIPHPTTWLNEGRYLDAEPSHGATAATGPPPGLTEHQQRDWMRGWRPGMPSGEELSRRLANGKARPNRRPSGADDQGELLAACADDDAGAGLRQRDRH